MRKLLLAAAAVLAIFLIGKFLVDATKDFHTRKAASIIRA